ncbi:thioesterase II family protein, partial [Streptosporangium algeriense]
MTIRPALPERRSAREPSGENVTGSCDSVRLFLFHHAGGSRLIFHGWDERFPAGWEVHAPDAPGRGRKHDVPAADNDVELVDHFLTELSPLLDRPFAFFGHSMGALVAYELARRLRDEAGPQPVWLGLSACGSPRPSGAGGPRSTSSDEELRNWLLSAGGTSGEVARHPLTWRMIGPLLRRDLRVIETWRPDVDAPPLDAALSV